MWVVTKNKPHDHLQPKNKLPFSEKSIIPIKKQYIIEIAKILNVVSSTYPSVVFIIL